MEKEFVVVVVFVFLVFCACGNSNNQGAKEQEGHAICHDPRVADLLTVRVVDAEVH